MLESRPRTEASMSRAMRLCTIATLLLWMQALPVAVLCQETEPAGQQEETLSDEADIFSVLEDPTAVGCLPPNTQEKVLIIVGCFAIAIACFFLVVRLAERSFINRDRSALLGRHWGISWTILIVTGGLAALNYLITGCLHKEMYIWLGFCGAVWLIHLIYLLIVVRSD